MTPAEIQALRKIADDLERAAAARFRERDRSDDDNWRQANHRRGLLRQAYAQFCRGLAEKYPAAEADQAAA